MYLGEALYICRPEFVPGYTTRMGVALNLVEDAHHVLRPPQAHITHYRIQYEAKTAGETTILLRNDDFL